MIFALLLALQAPAAPDTLPRWRAEAGYALDHHARDRSDWTRARAALSHRSGATVLLAEGWNAVRFGVTDRGGALELDFRAAPRLGIHLRGEVAPDARVTPTGGVTAAVTRGFPRGWEGTVHYRRMEYPGEGFDLYGAGVGRYRGRWYLRADATLVPHAGAVGATMGLAARRYGGSGDRDDLIELRLGGGREVVTLGAGLPPALRRTTSAALWGTRPLGRGWGGLLSLGWTSEAAAPARVSAGAGVFLRW